MNLTAEQLKRENPAVYNEIYMQGMMEERTKYRALVASGAISIKDSAVQCILNDASSVEAVALAGTIHRIIDDKNTLDSTLNKVVNKHAADLTKEEAAAAKSIASYMNKNRR